jgi:hypothetical protein
MDVNDLESAINSAKNFVPPREENAQKMTVGQEASFHKGAISTLINERNELAKMIGNVESIIQMHIKRLKELEK